MKIFAKILPRRIRERYEENARYARIKDVGRAIGVYILLGVILAGISGFLFSSFFSTAVSIALSFVLLIFIEVFLYYSIVLKADSIARKLEKVLPDALQLMASNLRAGMTTERALLLSSRIEFGELKGEIDRVGREIATGKGISYALKDMASRFQSEKLKKSVQLINSGLASGGELASLLEQISSNLREAEFVEKKVRTNVLLYVIFISISIVVGAPALFGLSSFLIEVLTKQIGSINVPAATLTQLPFSMSSVGITPEFIMIYLLVMITTTSVLGGLVLGLISRGEEKAGIKYIPFLLAISLIVFFLVRMVVKSVLAGIFGI